MIVGKGGCVCMCFSVCGGVIGWCCDGVIDWWEMIGFLKVEWGVEEWVVVLRGIGMELGGKFCGGVVELIDMEEW